MRLDFSEKAVIDARDILGIIFPNKGTRPAARVFVSWLVKRGGQASKGEISRFADLIQDPNNTLAGPDQPPARISRNNFYSTILKRLVDLGFIMSDVNIWNERQRRTNWVYQLIRFDLPGRPPPPGFYRIAWYICKKWNQRIGAASV